MPGAPSHGAPNWLLCGAKRGEDAKTPRACYELRRAGRGGWGMESRKLYRSDVSDDE